MYVCVECQLEMKPDINGVGLLQMYENGPYKLFQGDQWICPDCGNQIVAGIPLNPMAEHFEKGFRKKIADAKKRAEPLIMCWQNITQRDTAKNKGLSAEGGLD